MFMQQSQNSKFGTEEQRKKMEDRKYMDSRVEQIIQLDDIDRDGRLTLNEIGPRWNHLRQKKAGDKKKKNEL